MKLIAAIAVAASFLLPMGTSAAPDVPRTGATIDISAVSGDDGELQKGVPIPIPRFTDNSNGTITDNLTDLIWLRNANCLGSLDVAAPFTWLEAMETANNLQSGQCGLEDGSVLGDWRLPNIRELVSLINFNYHNPALSNTVGTGQWSEGNPFINVQGLSSFYWSSTTDMNPINSGTFAHTANIARGITNIYNKTNPIDDDVTPPIQVSTFAWPVKDCSSIGGGGCN